MIRLTLCILCVCIIIPIESIQVKTALGKIKGKRVNDETTGACYDSFEGIPYAEPPVGDLRYMPPVRKQRWNNVFDATKPGLVCPQTELYHSRKKMDENCLNLNIYTPANRSTELLPVVFNIHGGGFDSQSGNAKPLYGPQLFILQNIIVVTTNYRIGVLGFLSLCNEEISGNAGLKDVLLALQIINEIIAKFGGDPNKITVRGDGAGAAMVGFLMLTNQCEDLFQRAILQSGSFLSTKYVQLHPRDNAMLLARYLGLNVSNYEYMVEQLKQVDAFEIVKAQQAIARNDPRRGLRYSKPFTPTVEIECDSAVMKPGAVITRPPLELIKEGRIYDVPVAIGFNNMEGLEIFPQLRHEPRLIDKLNENFKLLIPEDIKYPEGSVEARKLTNQIRYLYFRGENITFFNIVDYINFISDIYHNFAIDRFVQYFKENKQSPVYYSVLGYDNELNWFKAFANITFPGAAHFDEIGFVFLTSVTKPRYPYLDSNTKTVQENILYSIKNFVYYGEPPASAGWPEAGQDRRHMYLNDYAPLPVYHRPLPERLGFWSSVYDEYFDSTWASATYFCTNDDVNSVQ